MSIIRPFNALVPAAAIAAKVASKPYDVMNRAEAKEMAAGNEASFLHITRAEIDCDEDVDIHSPEVYEKAKFNLTKFIEKNILHLQGKACYYVYRLIMDGRSQTGLVCASSIADYNNNLIKKHEFTRPEKEKDRIDHMLTIGAQTGNVFLAYNDVQDINNSIENIKVSVEPTYNFVTDDGISHTVWCVQNDEMIASITAAFANQVPHTYIADGHHRCASAAKVASLKTDNDAAQYFLTTLFPASELAILDYNRLITDTNGHTKESLLEALNENFEVITATEMVKPTQPKQIGMYAFGQWFSLQAKENTFKTDPVNILDISILQQNILSPIFNLHDQRTDKRIDFVGGIRGIAPLQKRVDSGEMAVAFSLYPVSIQQLFNIADLGEVMPPKSTWFEPKLSDGLLTYVFEN
jgi:uncharacterized protein (DUF1015 family)